MSLQIICYPRFNTVLEVTMIEKWRKNVDKVGSCVALLTDLSKTFDWIVHGFLVAKLEAYGFS